ncbi:MAG: hypothetical protein QW560_04590 [Candidatus Nitrosocaldus sp.]
MSYMIIHAIKTRPIVAVMTSLGIFLLMPLIRSINTALAWEIWFADILNKPFNATLYIIFAILFGIYITLYIHTRSVSCCDINAMKYAKHGIIGSVLGFIAGLCPACFSFIAFLLPLSASITLTAYSPLLTVLSIAIITFSIYKQGGFKNVYRKQ